MPEWWAGERCPELVSEEDSLPVRRVPLLIGDRTQ